MIHHNKKFKYPMSNPVRLIDVDGKPKLEYLE